MVIDCFQVHVPTRLSAPLCKKNVCFVVDFYTLNIGSGSFLSLNDFNVSVVYNVHTHSLSLPLRGGA